MKQKKLKTYRLQVDGRLIEFKAPNKVAAIQLRDRLFDHIKAQRALEAEACRRVERDVVKKEYDRLTGKE